MKKSETNSRQFSKRIGFGCGVGSFKPKHQKEGMWNKQATYKEELHCDVSRKKTIGGFLCFRFDALTVVRTFM